MSKYDAWHIDRDLAAAYTGSTTGTALTASIEQHLMSCGECRELIGDTVEPVRLETNWSAVLDQVQAPPLRLELLLRRLGVNEPTSRLVALTPSLRGAWVLSIATVLLLALVVCFQNPHGIAFFLAAAPVLPAAGVAFSFGPQADPLHEITAASPYPTIRLLALRTALVVASTLPASVVTGLVIPGPPWLATAWLLPALALSTATVALGTRIRPLWAVIGLCAVWLSVTLPALSPRRDAELVATPALQLACIAVLALSAAALLVERRNLSELIRRTS